MFCPCCADSSTRGAETIAAVSPIQPDAVSRPEEKAPAQGKEPLQPSRAVVIQEAPAMVAEAAPQEKPVVEEKQAVQEKQIVEEPKVLQEKQKETLPPAEDPKPTPTPVEEKPAPAEAAAPAASVPAPALEKGAVIEVTLWKTKEQSKLGLDVDKTTGPTVKILKVKEGLVGDYNKAAKASGKTEIKAGYEIIEVNGITSGPAAMVDEVARSNDLKLKIRTL
mmetsp:Transcript_43695/g.95124  ORF Transcript_43695/g.95124 Transcript_43695/m.95124 type:complete len:222 (+) Transcript_43695:69-734(+)